MKLLLISIIGLAITSCIDSASISKVQFKFNQDGSKSVIIGDDYVKAKETGLAKSESSK